MVLLANAWSAVRLRTREISEAIAAVCPVKSWKCEFGRSDVTTNAREQGLEASPARYWPVMPAFPRASENSGPPAGYGGFGWPVAR